MRFILSFFIISLFITPFKSLSETLDADSSRWLGEVTVTAIKQSSDLTLTPGAVTVVNSHQAQMWNIDAMKSISEIAPNFFMPRYGSRMTSSIYVRGIGARMDQPSVGLNVDNVPYLNKDAYDFDLMDIDRIEVLRGPQSTLYGRNTMAGLVNIYTLQPMQFQGDRVVGTFANGPEANLGISHYAKFSESLAMGFSGYFKFTDGFYRNYYTARKVDGEKSLNLRWKTQWAPADRWLIENVASFSLSRENGYPYEYAGSGEINYNDTCFYRRNSLTDGLTVKWNGNGFSVSSITSVQYIDDNMTLDQDFLPLSYFTLTQARHEYSITQDFIARGTKGAYSWVGGLFGFYKQGNMNAPVTLKEDGIARLITDNVNLNDRIPIKLVFDEPEILLGSHFKLPTWGIAAYHQSTFDLGRWNFALGLRLDYESNRMDYVSTCNAPVSVYMKSGIPPVAIMQKTADIDLHGRLKNDFLEFLPKFTVSYELPMKSSSSVYASVGKGYKSGGYNYQMFSEVLQQAMKAEVMSWMPGMTEPSESKYNIDDFVSYRPEKSWNYEVGAHIGCADGRVMTDIALFYIDCRDQQLTMFPDDESTTGRLTTNAGKSRSFGTEIQIKYYPTERWMLNLSYGYTNAKFVRFKDGESDYKGRYVPYAPLNTLFGSVAYTHPAGKNVTMIYNVDCRGIGKIYWNESNVDSQSFYALMGLSITAKWRWLSVEGWMENVTGTKYDTFFFESLKNKFLQRGNPRRFGLTVRLNFNTI
ncbi:MAG: TonB-dependent receptor [Bacteroides sp.]|nr:TonB-dependent receptor [Bacteroides sp.]